MLMKGVSSGLLDRQAMDYEQIITALSYPITKSNTLIQHSRYSLTLRQQKILLYIVSQLKPDQTRFDWQVFDIREFCTFCGIDNNNGNNYRNLKAAIKQIKDTSWWVDMENGKSRLISWIQKAEIESGTGKISILLDDDMLPYLLDMKERFTVYSLGCVIAMRSQHSIRLYELLKSLQNKDEKLVFTLPTLKNRLGIGESEYSNGGDFKKRVIDTAVAEINAITDLNVKYELIYSGRKISKVAFDVWAKPIMDRMQARAIVEINIGAC